MHRRAGLQKLLPKREIVLRCRMPEKFLEKARGEGCAILEAVCGPEHGLRMLVRGQDAPVVLELAERYSLEVAADRAVGPDIRKWIGGAWPFALGAALVLAAFLRLSGYIWQIEVRCPEGGESSAVYAALEEAGVFPGESFPEEDPLARELESLCPGYAHISVRREGVVLKVEAYRETEAPEIFDEKAARDIVARCDAVVEEVTVLTGTAAVKPGDVVKKGQVLILGEERETDESTRGVRALGEATGMVWAWAEAQADCVQLRQTLTGNERTRAVLRLMGWEWPLKEAEDFDAQESETERIAVGGVFVPLEIVRQRLRETKTEKQEIPFREQAAALEAKTMAEAMGKLPQNAQIIDKWTDYSMMEDNRLVFRLCLQARVPIAAARGRPE